MPSERPVERLNDILENIDRVASYIEGMDADSFSSDHLRRDAEERCVERISEAAKKLGPAAEQLIPDQNWHEIRAVGNVLRHMYDDVDPEIIWQIATVDLPRLSAAVRHALDRGVT